MLVSFPSRFAHRAALALRAISDLLSGLVEIARALPPRNPPNREACLRLLGVDSSDNAA